MEELLPVVGLNKEGIVGVNSIETRKIDGEEGAILYKLTKDDYTISHTFSALIIGYCRNSFIIGISVLTSSDFSNVEIKRLAGNTAGVSFYCDTEGVYYKKNDTSASTFCMTLIANGYHVFAPLFTPNPKGNDISSLKQIEIV